MAARWRRRRARRVARWWPDRNRPDPALQPRAPRSVRAGRASRDRRSAQQTGWHHDPPSPPPTRRL